MTRNKAPIVIGIEYTKWYLLCDVSKPFRSARTGVFQLDKIFDISFRSTISWPSKGHNILGDGTLDDIASSLGDNSGVIFLKIDKYPSSLFGSLTGPNVKKLVSAES